MHSVVNEVVAFQYSRGRREACQVRKSSKHTDAHADDTGNVGLQSLLLAAVNMTHGHTVLVP